MDDGARNKAGNDMEGFFQALGNRTRLRLLNLVATGEICVCHLVEILEEPQPRISQHLACLRGLGIVAARREGKWMHYSLTSPHSPAAAAVLEETLAWIAADKPMKAERAKLKKLCCKSTVDRIKE